LKESYPDSLGFQVYDAEDIIIKEKGQRKYDDMLEERKEREE